tara:strand:- start:80 stop:439 length:360 start_codon:yes stop_codon:yes gene_type:complete
MKYSNIKSPFIKKQLKKTAWDNRSYIDDLIKLHEYMTDGIKSWLAASLFSELTFKYEKEYLKLIDEDTSLNPNEKRVKMYPKQIRDLKLRNKKIIKWKLDDIKQEMLLKEDWNLATKKF